MPYGELCRCCLLRPPDRGLKTQYSMVGKSEVYADMLKECFEIQMSCTEENEMGICEICVTRLRDASDFKLQVQQCQKQLMTQLKGFTVKDETSPKVKEEYLDLDDDNDIYFLELKEEASDGFELKGDDDDDKKLAEMFGFTDVTVKRTSDRRRTKKRLLLDNGRNELKEEVSDDFGFNDDDNKKLAEMFGIKRKNKKRLLLDNGLNDLNPKSRIKLSLHVGQSRLLASPRHSGVSDAKKYRANVEALLKYSNCTPFGTKTIAGILCAYCKTTYKDLPHLRTHLQEEHKSDSLIDNMRMDKNNLSIKMDITDLTCNLCQANINTIANLKDHLIKEHDKKLYTDVNDYILEFKLTDGEILNCALCNSTYETFKMLLQHMNGHYRNYICEICDLGFINKHKLKGHQRTHEIGNFNCSFCDKVFTTRVRKLCHEKYTHNSGARYTTNCPHCDQSFTSYYRRNRHMAVEHNTAAATYKCNICVKSFILKSKLTSHIKKVHLMERNHICSECGQGFFIKQSLDEHMVKHNGERVFKCTVCTKAYARKKTLREHMRIHNNDRRFKCGICALAFVQKCSLKSHMLSNHSMTLAEYENTRSEISP
nr:zinc finger protein 614 [Helicoverpa armigera]